MLPGMTADHKSLNLRVFSVNRQHDGVALANLKRRRDEPSIPDRARGITMPYFIPDLARRSVLRRGNRVIFVY